MLPENSNWIRHSFIAGSSLCLSSMRSQSAFISDSICNVRYGIVKEKNCTKIKSNRMTWQTICIHTHRWFNGLVSSIVRVWISKMNENAYLKISHNNFIDTQWRVNGSNAICTPYGFLGLLFLVLRYVRPPLRLTVKSHNQILSIFLWIRMSSVCCCCCETVL